MFVKIGPGRVSNVAVCGLYSETPRMSDGSRSLVNWMRRKLEAQRAASARAPSFSSYSALQLRHDGRIGQRGGVAERAALGDVAQQAAHDLARPRLRQVRRNRMSSGRDRADLVATCSRRSSLQLLVADALLHRDERGDRLALHLVRAADDGGLRDRRVVDQRALHFHRADAVAGHVQHVVDAAEDPEVAVVVALRAVAREVDAVPARPVVLAEALVVAPDRAQHARPRLRDGQVAAPARCRPPQSARPR
jgi:hypothetical protein